MINRSTDAYGRTNAILPRKGRAASFIHFSGSGRPNECLMRRQHDHSGCTDNGAGTRSYNNGADRVCRYPAGGVD